MILPFVWLAISTPPLNIVHVISDDLRPEIGSYGIPHRHTPNIDSLAASGVVFDRAYAQQAVCGPSRNSFLTGRRPDASRTWNFINHFREDHPDWTTLPGMFKKAGRLSLGAGKVYHPDMPPQWDGAKSWSEPALPFQNPCWFYGVSCLPCVGLNGTQIVPLCNDGGFGPGSVRTCWCEIEATEDVLTVDYALALLNSTSAVTRDANAIPNPFYLAVGLHKPHLPWQAKSEHFDFYRNLSSHGLIPPAQHKVAPTGMPGIAFASCDSPSPWHPIDDTDAIQARIAYLAAASGMDEQVGRLIDGLREAGVMNSTVVIFHSDHGWQLGEHGEWRKNTNFELATRVPLIVSGPEWWIGDSAGTRVGNIVELVDIMPTVADIAGINLTAVMGKNETPLAGRSLVPLIFAQDISVVSGPRGNRSPARAQISDWVSFSQYPRHVKNQSEPWASNGIDHTERSEFTAMGYTIRTHEWRYTEWRTWNGTSLVADWTPAGLIANELYDHRDESTFPSNFDIGENVNLAHNSTLSNGSLPISELSLRLWNEFGKTTSHNLADKGLNRDR